MTSAQVEMACPPPLPNNNDDNAIWHYSDQGASHGPVSAMTLADLYSRGTIHDETLVWSETRRGEWEKYSTLRSQLSPGTPPPLPLSQISDFWVWMIALTPIVGHVIEVTIAGGQPEFYGPEILVYALAYGAFAFMDANAIRNSGRSEQTTTAALGLFLVPLYLLVRSKRLGKSQLPLAGWVAAMFAVAYIPTHHILELTNVSFSLPTCESRTSITQIKSLFPQIPLNLGSLPAIDVKDVETTQSVDGMNYCKATVVSAGGTNFDVTYTIEEVDGQYMYYLQLAF